MMKLMDEKISAICKYYLNCLSLERIQGISVFLTGKFDLKYQETAHVNEKCFEEPKVVEFLNKFSSRNMNLYLGYPCLIKKIYSPKNNDYFHMLIPVLIWSIEYHAGKAHLSNIPNINKEVIQTYQGKNGNIQSYELIELEDQLGLNGKDSIIVEELVEHLQNIRRWNWREKISTETICAELPISKLTEEGIYNRAVIIASNKPAYTLGLESELMALSQMKEAQYKGTALYNWINCCSNHSESFEGIQNNLLEVLPMNVEQRQAVQKALNSNLTIVTGPPGTGKSQVVTNLLINMALQGKNVLFASKNNKAVDVVETRVNEIGKSPILLRMGNDFHQNNLGQLVSYLLNSIVDEQEKKKYKELKVKYEKNREQYEDLLEDKENLIKVRNELDAIEQQYCFIRRNFEKSFAKIDHCSFFKLKTLAERLRVAFYKTMKYRQPFFVRLFWFCIKYFNNNRFKKIRKNLNELLNFLNVDVFIEDSLTEESFSGICKIIDKVVSNLDITLRYKIALETLKNLEGLESIDRKLLNLESECTNVANDLWNSWLAIKPSTILSLDRKKMGQYMAATKLVNGYKSHDISPKLKEKLEHLQVEISKFLPCWAVTSLSAKGRIPFLPGIFDLLVIDEASQCDIASILPLLYRSKRVVIIGDPMQLSHISSLTKKQDDVLIQKYGIDLGWSYSSSSLYDVASTLVESKHIVHLRDHHRCHEDIIGFSNTEFYNNKLRVATSYRKLKQDKNISLGIQWNDIAGKVISPWNGSAYNADEVNAVLNYLDRLEQIDYNGTIGVVTPFRSQAEKIQKAIEEHSKLNQMFLKNDLLVDTVHKFQGDERDLIIFSSVVSNGMTAGATEFLKNTGNLFNVAITRARSALYVVGNREYCRYCDISYMEHFVKYVEELNKENQTENVSSSSQNNKQISEWEEYLYKKLMEAGIKTIPQLPVDKYCLDLALKIKDRKLDIEIDGEMYHKDWNGELCYRDKLRNQRLIELGWDIKRFWVYQLRDNLNWCIDEIKNWINQ